MLVRSAGCFYGEAIRRSFHEGIGSRYDEISGLDRAVPNWDLRAGAVIFPCGDLENLEEKSLCHP